MIDAWVDEVSRWEDDVCAFVCVSTWPCICIIILCGERRSKICRNIQNIVYSNFLNPVKAVKFNCRLTRAPLGSAEQRTPLGGAILPPPLRSREPRNVATSGKRRWIALGVNSLNHVNFLKIEVTGQVKLRSKVKYYSFYNGAYWGQTKHYKCFFLDGL